MWPFSVARPEQKSADQSSPSPAPKQNGARSKGERRRPEKAIEGGSPSRKGARGAWLQHSRSGCLPPDPAPRDIFTTGPPFRAVWHRQQATVAQLVLCAGEMGQGYHLRYILTRRWWRGLRKRNNAASPLRPGCCPAMPRIVSRYQLHMYSVPILLGPPRPQTTSLLESTSSCAWVAPALSLCSTSPLTPWRSAKVELGVQAALLRADLTSL